MRVQEISGKDVHNMKARSLLKRGPNSVGQGRLDLRGGRGVQRVQGCLGRVQGASRGGPWGGPGALGAFRAKKRQKHKKTRKSVFRT